MKLTISLPGSFPDTLKLTTQTSLSSPILLLYSSMCNSLFTNLLRSPISKLSLSSLSLVSIVSTILDV